MVRTASRLIGDRLSNINYIEEVPEGLLLQGHENSLCQVLLNLMKNGVEATETAGRKADEAELRITGEDTGDGLVLRVRDNGCGIPEAERNRMFEPFFTTKDRGRGMGLGLSICRRILSDHGGTIDVQSVEGQLTEFTLRFVPGEGQDSETLRAASEEGMMNHPIRHIGARV